MTRIVAGSAGGRRLAVPPRGIRPTSERVREALFSALDATGELRGARVLDLYAGSGALGLEALSRGAAHATLVDSDRRAVRVLRGNVATLGLPGAEVRSCTVRAALAAPPADPYHVVLADPPYDLDPAEVAAVLAALMVPGWLVPRALLVVERPARAGELAWPEPISAVRWRRYGETALCYGRAP